jgi:hypothetical protein
VSGATFELRAAARGKGVMSGAGGGAAGAHVAPPTENQSRAGDSAARMTTAVLRARAYNTASCNTHC